MKTILVIAMFLLMVSFISQAEAITPTSRTELSDVTLSTWTDVDVTAYVDAGNTAGVILEIVNTSGTEYDFGVRNNGSTQANAFGAIEDTGHTWVAIGVDGDDIFELYQGNAAVDVFIVGYISNEEGTFFTNHIDKSLDVGDVGTWTDINISGDTTGGDVAICAFFLIDNVDAGDSWQWGFRENGSTDDRVQQLFGGGNGDRRGGMMSVDGSEILEGFISNIGVKFFLTGYLTSNFTSFTNGEDYSTGTTGSYIDVDFSSDIPAGNTGAFVQLWNSGAFDFGDEAANIIKKDEGSDSYYDISNHQYIWTEINSSRVAEQKIETTDMDLYLWGYTNITPSSAIKTINGLAKASVKTIDGLAIGSVKTWNGLE